MADADIVLWVVDASQPDHPDDDMILEELAGRSARAPRPPGPEQGGPRDEAAAPPPASRPGASATRSPRSSPLSAATGDNVGGLDACLLRVAPAGHPFYPPEELSDRPERFFIAEVLREQAFALLHQELPYAVAVRIEAVRARDGRDLTDVEATLCVEKESQKGIVIGRGGAMLKRIGTAARPEIEVDVDVDNLGARLIGEQFGFRRHETQG